MRRFYNFCNNNNLQEYFKPIYDNTTVTNSILASRRNIWYASNPKVSWCHEHNLCLLFTMYILALLLSTFSHATLPHLALNSIALYSFGPILLSRLNYSHEDLLALYATAGTFSSFGKCLQYHT